MLTTGQVCEMALERQQNTDEGIVFAATFSEHEVSQFINELAPKAERGRNLTRALNENVDGDFITTTYAYENILVRVYGIIRSAPGGNSVITITWRKRKCSGKTANMRLTSPIGAPSKPAP
jgi:hypothetical protein